MYQKGQIDATTAMKMLVDLSAPVGVEPCDNRNLDVGSRKRKSSPAVPSESEDDDALEAELDTAVMDSLLDQDMMSISFYINISTFLFLSTLVCCKEIRLFQYHIHLWLTPAVASKDTKTKNALKAKLRRLCELKKGKKLQVPEWLHKKWLEEKGNHLEMAMAHKNANFDKDPIPQCESTH